MGYLHHLDGTLNLARALLAHAGGCCLLFASSAEIYGGSFASGRPVDEVALLAPNEHLCRDKSSGRSGIGCNGQ
jgi:GDP-4-dehydro-6-deoxy-D-mannose reductase